MIINDHCHGSALYNLFNLQAYWSINTHYFYSQFCIYCNCWCWFPHIVTVHKVNTFDVTFHGTLHTQSCSPVHVSNEITATFFVRLT